MLQFHQERLEASAHILLDAEDYSSSQHGLEQQTVQEVLAMGRLIASKQFPSYIKILPQELK